MAKKSKHTPASISQYRELAETFRESQARLKAIWEGAPIAMALSDSEGTVLDVNKAYIELYGLSRTQIIGKNFSVIFPPHSRSRAREIYKKTFSSKKHSSVVEATVLSRNGTPRIVESQYSFIDENGKRKAMLSIIKDVTEQKKFERTLIEKEERFRTLIEQSTDAVQLVTPEGKILYTSESIKNVLGYTVEELQGKGILPFMHKDDIPGFTKKFGELLKKPGNRITFQYRVKHKDGSWAWLETVGVNHLNTPNINALVGTFRNITSRMELERQKDDFLGIASHELKTPVTSIKAYAQVLEAMFRRKGDMQAAELLQKLDAQVNKLTILISDLLDVTKIQSGNLVLQAEQFDLNTFIQEIVQELQLTTERHELIVKLDKTTTLFGDKERLAQVITNLVSNAIKYSPHGKRIIISSKRGNGSITVSVQDFGIGISKEKLPHIFERFYRASGAKESTFPGLGLGLYISSEIVKRQGGTIWVESVESKGSTFYFSLPLISKAKKRKSTLAKEEIKHE